MIELDATNRHEWLVKLFMERYMHNTHVQHILLPLNLQPLDVASVECHCSSSRLPRRRAAQCQTPMVKRRGFGWWWRRKKGKEVESGRDGGRQGGRKPRPVNPSRRKHISMASFFGSTKSGKLRRTEVQSVRMRLETGPMHRTSPTV